MHHSKNRSLRRIGRGLVHHLAVMTGAVGFTLAFFLILPLLQRISQPPTGDRQLSQVDIAIPPPPPPPPEEEEPEEEDQEPDEIEDVDLSEEPEPLDLSMLELALNAGGAGGWGSGDFGVGLGDPATRAQQVADIFGASELDQKPRAIFQPGPRLDGRMRSRGPGQVVVIFIVDADGRVSEARVDSSSDSVFERSALEAVRQWKFEPGMRGGEPVSFNMSQRFDFPGG